MFNRIFWKQEVSESTLKELNYILLYFLIVLLFLIFWSDLRDIEITKFFYNLREYGIDYFGNYFAKLLTIFSYIGVEQFFKAIIFPLLFFLGYKYLGIKALTALIFGGGVAFFFRMITELPRPFFMEMGYYEPGFSFPSGHIVQLIMVLGIIAFFYQNKIFNFLSVLLILFVGFSRLLFGFHSLDDILAGIIIGVGALYLFLKLIEILQNKGVDFVCFLSVILLLGIPFYILFLTDDLSRYAMLLLYLCGVVIGYYLSELNFLKNFEINEERLSRFLHALFCMILTITIYILIEVSLEAISDNYDLLMCFLFGLLISFLVPFFLKVLNYFIKNKVLYSLNKPK